MSDLERMATEREEVEAALQESEARFRRLFEDSPVALWEADLSKVKAYLDAHHTDNIAGFRAHLRESPEMVMRFASLVELRDVNPATLKLYKATSKEQFLESLERLFFEESSDAIAEAVLALASGKSGRETILTQRTLTDEQIVVAVSQSIAPGHEETWDRVIISVLDLTERVRAEMRADDSRALAAALTDTAAALNSTLEIEEVLDRILANVGRVVPHDAANVMLLDPQKETARFVRQRGYPTPKATNGATKRSRLRLAETPNLRQMLESGRPLVIEDLQASPDWVAFPETKWARSYVGAPIRREESVLGFLTLMSSEPGFFTNEQAGHLIAFADQAAIAIENARLYEQVQEHAAQLEALHRVTLDITAELGLEPLLKTLVERALELANATGGGIYLYRPRSDDLIWMFSVGHDYVPSGNVLKRGEGMSGRVLESGEPLIVDNYSKWTGRAPQIQATPEVAAVAVPIRWGAEFLGVILAHVETPRTFSKRDADLTSRFADQAAIAIRNARLYEQVQGHAAQLEALHRVALDITAELGLEPLLKTLTERALELVNATGGGIYLYRPECDGLEWMFNVGHKYVSTGTILKRGEGMSGKVLETGEPLIVDSYATWEGHSPQIETTPDVGAVAVPIRWGDEFLGVIVVYAETPRTFSERDADLTSLFADHAAIAIRNARLYEEVQEHAAQLEALHRVTLDITAELGLETLLNTLVKRALELANAAGGGIYLYRPERDELEWAFSVGQTDVWPGATLKRGEGLSGKVLESGEPMIVEHYAEWEGRSSRITVEDDITVVGVPIRWGDEFLGVFAAHTIAPRTFSIRDADLTRLFADQAAIAIRNARLYEEVQEHAAQLEALHRVTLDITAELDLESLLKTLIERALELANARGGGVYLYQPERDKLEWAFSVGQSFVKVGTILKRGEGLSGRVWESGETLIVDDYATWKGRAEHIDVPPHLTVVGAPIRWGDEFLGVITANAQAPHSLSSREADVLRLFADQAAVAIRNVRLYEQVKQKAAELEALHRTALDITAELGIDALTEKLLAQAVGLLDAQGSGLFLVRPDLDVMELTQSVGEIDLAIGTQFQRGDGLAGKVWVEGKPLKMDDYKTWEGKSRTFSLRADMALVGAPIRSGDTFLGVLSINDRPPRTFSEQDMDLLGLFADQTAVALKNARLYEQVQQHAAQLEALQRVTLDITTELKLETLLQTLVERAMELLDAPSGGLYLYHPEREVIEWSVSIGPNHAPLGSILRRGEGLSGKVWESGSALFVDNYSEWEGRADVYEGMQWGAVMGVPVHWGDEFLGVINATFDNQRQFTDSDAELLSQFAAQAAVAIKNARLFDAIQHHADRLEERVAERTAELNAANENLKRLSRLKDEFVANVSHEMRTPITNLKLYHKLMQHVAPDTLQEYLDTFRRETERLEHTIEALLRLSRLDQGEMEFRPTMIDLNTMVENLVSDRKSLAEERGLTLEAETAPEMTPVQADEDLLGQALSILVINALSYTPSGGRVSIRTQFADSRQSYEGQWAGVSVIDNGPGIPADEQEHIFERFYRGAVGHTSKVPGTGLGLAIAQEIVAHHQGQIEVQSSGIMGEGATFNVWLPIER